MKRISLITASLALTSPLMAQTPHAEHDNKEKHRVSEHHDSLTHIEVLTVHGQKTANAWNEAVESVTVTFVAVPVVS